MKIKQKEVLRFVAYSYLFPEIEKPRNQRRSLEILEGAIQVYGKLGAVGATDELIAKAAGVSRPLIFRYFKDREVLFETATKYVRVNFQYFVIGAIEKEKTAEGMLRAYVKATLQWTEEYPDHARVLLYFLYTCTQKKSESRVNTEFNEASQKRLEAILQKGQQEGSFQLSDISATAKMIQTLIIGGMVTWVTEEIRMEKIEYQTSLIKTCLGLLGVLKVFKTP